MFLSTRFVKKNFYSTSTPSALKKVTLIPGDGIGPEISESVKRIFSAARVPLEFESVDVAPVYDEERAKMYIPSASLDSIRKNKIALKGIYNCCATVCNFLKARLLLRLVKVTSR
jgi:isocitrate dehydrogenase (NAD+)